MYPEEKKFKHELMKEKRRTRVLTDLVDLQSKVINQLQTLLAYQTKPLCRLGHYGCYIDHKNTILSSLKVSPPLRLKLELSILS